MTKSAWIITVCFAIWCSEYLQAQTEEAWAAISGHVYTLDGKPLAHAKIEVFPLETAIFGPLPSATSDEEGAYHLQSPGFGKTRICARLEALGYPKTQYKLFASGKEAFPEVVLTPAGDLTNVDIHLGPSDGFVEGVVIDKETQSVIQFARITLQWTEEPSVSYLSSLPGTGTFQYALPRRAISLKVTAPGYSPWNYADPKTHAAYIEVDQADRKSIKVELERLPVSAPH